MSKPKRQKMNPEWKAKWLEALRSGRFQQGRDQLATNIYGFDEDLDDERVVDREYCCLGVLACVVDPEQKDWRDGESELPPALADKVGLVDNHDTEGGVQDMLAGLNDHQEWSFKKIAAYIERYL